MTWSIEDSQFIYGIGQDDLHFLSIMENGQLAITIQNKTTSLIELVKNVGAHFPNRKMTPSFTLRTPQLITSQIDKLLSTFDKHKSELGYNGAFKPLYPIKVNQHKREVTKVLKSSTRYGLEAGTKSELFVILKVLRDSKDRIIMCNGVKDRAYVNIVKDAIKDGYNIIISIESVTELLHVIELLPRDKLQLYLRIKPYVSMHGYWGSSAGRNSKFGLSIADLNRVMNLLKENNLSQRLFGIHAHPGSQVANSYELAQYFKFLVKTFVHLKKNGFEYLHTINFGGGLPIDYDGRLPKDNVERYAFAMIDTIVKVMETEGLAHPDIMIEAGRYITAQSSMLVIQPLEFHRIFPQFTNEELEGLINRYPDLNLVQSIEDILSLWEKWNNLPDHLDLDQLNVYEKDLAMVKYYLRRLFFTKLFTLDHLKLESVKDLISPDYFLLGNFSVFNGACDYVLIDQYFPMFAIDNLHKQPETLIRLVDITCDSDGEISVFRTAESDRDLYSKDGYPLASKDPLEWKGFPVGDVSSILQSYIVIPLVGAYQDVIEFDHNLIGDLPDVEYRIIDGKEQIDVVTQATNVQELLKDVGYNLKNKRNPYISTEATE